MNAYKLIGAILLGGASAVAIDVAKNTFIYEKQNYPTKRAIGLFIALFTGAVIVYLAAKGKESQHPPSEYEGIDDTYKGIIINPELAKQTCYCEEVCIPRCYAKGVIGALNKREVMEFCPQYADLFKQFTKRGIEATLIPKREVASQSQEITINLPNQRV